jgi:hypothetical protein
MNGRAARQGLLAVTWAIALASTPAGCGGGHASGGSGGAGAGGSTGAGAPKGVCGDDDCRLAEGENTHTCPRDCGAPGASGAQVQFFADFNSKATEYGQHVRFTYVVWNDGTEAAKNVVLPVPIVQNASTTVYGDRTFCDSGGKYDCMVDLSYVPGSMRINRVYHPNRARNSYYFVDTTPLSDGIDGDEAYHDAKANVLYLTLAELLPRSADPEVSGVVWSYELATDGGIAHTPCADKPRIQNWNWIFADNSDEYMNDIIGHILCASPRLRADIAASPGAPAPGDAVTFTLTMSYDDAAPPDGIAKDRFSLMRPMLFFNYPEEAVTIESIGSPDAEDLPGKGTPETGGVVFWARKDTQSDAIMAPGESDTLVVSARVKPGIPSGTPLSFTARVVSQNTLPYQQVDAEKTLSVAGSAPATCGDGLCSAAESAASCSKDCPACTREDRGTSLGEPPCCAGLKLIRAAYPYGWAYDQCYDWEGGGVQFAQGFCTACGDGVCKGNENACNCPEDCGPHCGNWICEEGESGSSCPADCGPSE